MGRFGYLFLVEFHWPVLPEHHTCQSCHIRELIGLRFLRSGILLLFPAAKDWLHVKHEVIPPTALLLIIFLAYYGFSSMAWFICGVSVSHAIFYSVMGPVNSSSGLFWTFQTSQLLTQAEKLIFSCYIRIVKFECGQVDIQFSNLQLREGYYYNQCAMERWIVGPRLLHSSSVVHGWSWLCVALSIPHPNSIYHGSLSQYCIWYETRRESPHNEVPNLRC